jgi:hypothetical protein
MTENQWLDKVEENWEALKQLVMQYHPRASYSPQPMQVTAPGAEMACEVVRRQIASEGGQPVTEELLDRLKSEGDVGELTSLFNEAWFGVPESTSCWGIEGFGELVNLLEDPPEQDE